MYHVSQLDKIAPICVSPPLAGDYREGCMACGCCICDCMYVWIPGRWRTEPAWAPHLPTVTMTGKLLISSRFCTFVLTDIWSQKKLKSFEMEKRPKMTNLSMPAMTAEKCVAPVVISDYSAGLMPAVRRGHISIQSLFRRRNYGMLSLSTTIPRPH